MYTRPICESSPSKSERRGAAWRYEELACGSSFLVESPRIRSCTAIFTAPCIFPYVDGETRRDRGECGGRKIARGNELSSERGADRGLGTEGYGGREGPLLGTSKLAS